MLKKKALIKLILIYLLVLSISLFFAFTLIKGSTDRTVEIVYVAVPQTSMIDYIKLEFVIAVGPALFYPNEFDLIKVFDSENNIKEFLKTNQVETLQFPSLNIKKIQKKLRGSGRTYCFQISLDKSILKDQSQSFIKPYILFLEDKLYDLATDKFNAFKQVKIDSLIERKKLILHSMGNISGNLRVLRELDLLRVEEEIDFIKARELEKNKVKIIEILDGLESKHTLPEKTFKYKAFVGLVSGTLFFLVIFRIFRKRILV